MATVALPAATSSRAPAHRTQPRCLTSTPRDTGNASASRPRSSPETSTSPTACPLRARARRRMRQRRLCPRLPRQRHRRHRHRGLRRVLRRHRRAGRHPRPARRRRSPADRHGHRFDLVRLKEVLEHVQQPLVAREGDAPRPPSRAASSSPTSRRSGRSSIPSPPTSTTTTPTFGPSAASASSACSRMPGSPTSRSRDTRRPYAPGNGRSAPSPRASSRSSGAPSPSTEASMRKNTRALIEVAARHLDLPQPIVEFGSFQVTPGTISDLRPVFRRQAIHRHRHSSRARRRSRRKSRAPRRSRTPRVGTAILLDTLEHVQDPPRAMAEIYRVLRSLAASPSLRPSWISSSTTSPTTGASHRPPSNISSARSTRRSSATTATPKSRIPCSPSASASLPPHCATAFAAIEAAYRQANRNWYWRVAQPYYAARDLLSIVRRNNAMGFEVVRGSVRRTRSAGLLCVRPRRRNGACIASALSARVPLSARPTPSSPPAHLHRRRTRLSDPMRCFRSSPNTCGHAMPHAYRSATTAASARTLSSAASTRSPSATVCSSRATCSSATPSTAMKTPRPPSSTSRCSSVAPSTSLMAPSSALTPSSFRACASAATPS